MITEYTLRPTGYQAEFAKHGVFRSIGGGPWYLVGFADPQLVEDYGYPKKLKDERSLEVSRYMAARLLGENSKDLEAAEAEAVAA